MSPDGTGGTSDGRIGLLPRSVNDPVKLDERLKSLLQGHGERSSPVKLDERRKTPCGAGGAARPHSAVLRGSSQAGRTVLRDESCRAHLLNLP